MNILLGDDDLPCAKFISYILEDAGYRVLKAYDGAEIFRSISRHHPDLVLLDVQLPSANGFGICRQIRRTSDVPIIFLSCHGRVEKRVLGLQVGADDYIVKPFEPADLLARIEAVLRRCQRGTMPALTRIHHHGLTLIPPEYTVMFDDEHTIELTPIEFHLLHYLMQNAGHTVTLRQILSSVWNDDDACETSVVTTYISRLRAKIETDPSHPHYIVTVRSMGYKFEL